MHTAGIWYSVLLLKELALPLEKYLVPICDILAGKTLKSDPCPVWNSRETSPFCLRSRPNQLDIFFRESVLNKKPRAGILIGGSLHDGGKPSQTLSVIIPSPKPGHSRH